MDPTKSFFSRPVSSEKLKKASGVTAKGDNEWAVTVYRVISALGSIGRSQFYLGVQEDFKEEATLS